MTYWYEASMLTIAINKPTKPVMFYLFNSASRLVTCGTFFNRKTNQTSLERSWVERFVGLLETL